MTELLSNAKMFQEMFVLPVVQAMETKLENMLTPVVDAQKNVTGRMNYVEGRVSSLESNQKKALVGWGVFASAGLGLIVVGWSKVKSLLHLN